ncbi:phage tail assembly protein [Komagataeibacter oboediens]|uniref:phage tail assembly protein n=1 Tax=Komagataeibacter oboediens TaxID=65958 RepID=UPI001C2C9670|nr:phage tail assembly protein [Komagataeibacter oboediens]MBV0888139.1 phage tail assembly protein [Komagataeibacter oboediens]MCK9820761.1 phage tail assembly protein [Komagataeibacter oboediens]
MNHHHRQPTDEEVMAIVIPAGSEAEQEDDEGKTLVIDLDPPLDVRKAGTFEELRLREPSVYQILCAAQAIGRQLTPETVYNSQIGLVARITGVPERAIIELPTTVLDRAIVFVTGFEEEARRKPDEMPDTAPSFSLIFPEPIEATGRTFSDMTLREPTVRERRIMKGAEAKGTPEAFLQAEIALVEAVSEWPKAAVLKMPISKFAQAADYLTGFFLSGPATGNA